jgi:hypothetical protein
MPSFSQILAQSVTDSGVKATVVYATADNLPLTGNTAGDIGLVSETNRLYIFTGTGWYNVALINTNPTIITGPAGSYTFATNGTPIVITLEAQDPEEVPIAWSYAVTSGLLGSTATVSQADNVFTITPSTNSADIGTFSITFTASDGINLATAASSFTLKFQNELLVPDGTTRLLAVSFNDGAISQSGSLTVTPVDIPSANLISYPSTGGVANSGYATGPFMNAKLQISFADIAALLDKTYIAWYKGSQSAAVGTYSPSVPIFGEVLNSVWWGLGLSGGKVCIANGSHHTGTTNVATNDWYCLAWTISSGGVANAYVNGVLEVSSISVNTNYPGASYIGAGYIYPGVEGPESLDAIQIFDGILSDAQILQIYNAAV